eukprot:Nk52_evm20s160 gene=Nk52_evmTU20s160
MHLNNTLLHSQFMEHATSAVSKHSRAVHCSAGRSASNSNKYKNEVTIKTGGEEEFITYSQLYECANAMKEAVLDCLQVRGNTSISTAHQQCQQRSKGVAVVVLPKGVPQVASVLGCSMGNVTFVPVSGAVVPEGRLAAILRHSGRLIHDNENDDDEEAAQKEVLVITSHELLSASPVLQAHVAAAGGDRTVLVDVVMKRVINARLAGNANMEEMADKSLVRTPDKVDDKKENFVAGTGSRYEGNFSADCPAYIIFTSGTTGVPKGIIVSHRNAMTTINEMNRRYGITKKDVTFGLSKIDFDLSIWDIFGTLSAGALLVLPTASTSQPQCSVSVPHPSSSSLMEDTNVLSWLNIIGEQNVTVWNSVPALMELLVDVSESTGASLPDSLRCVFMSGDWIPLNLPSRIRERLSSPSSASSLQIVSLGGATEASVWSVAYDIPACLSSTSEDMPSIPYGRALAGQSMYVVRRTESPVTGDQQRLEECAIGEEGRIVIGGGGVALGYLHNPKLTKASFFNAQLVPQFPSNPNDEGIQSGRFYETGDMGVYINQSEDDTNTQPLIRFLGREDFQVKINGNRIELGDVESAYLGAVTQSTVMGETDGHWRAVAVPNTARTAIHMFLTVEGQQTANFDRMKSHLGAVDEAAKSLLPKYMHPTSVLVVPKRDFPLTPNGKVDGKRLLGMLEKDSTSTTTTASSVNVPLPADEIEAKVLAIWKDVFEGDDDIKVVGLCDDFFDMLAGTSIQAMRIMARLNGAFHLSLQVSSIFRMRTVKQASDVIRELSSPEEQNLTSPEHSNTQNHRSNSTIKSLEDAKTPEDVVAYFHSIERDLIVPFNPIDQSNPNQRHNQPLFFFAPWGGDVALYAEFSRAVGQEFPFYALQLPNFQITDEREFFQMVFDGIRELQPSGVLNIGGYSQGAMQAYRFCVWATEELEVPQHVRLCQLDCLNVPHWSAMATVASRAWLPNDTRADALMWVMRAFNLLPPRWVPEALPAYTKPEIRAQSIRHAELMTPRERALEEQCGNVECHVLWSIFLCYQQRQPVWFSYKDFTKILTPTARAQYILTECQRRGILDHHVTVEMILFQWRVCLASFNVATSCLDLVRPSTRPDLFANAINIRAAGLWNDMSYSRTKFDPAGGLRDLMDPPQAAMVGDNAPQAQERRSESIRIKGSRHLDIVYAPFCYDSASEVRKFFSRF